LLLDNVPTSIGHIRSGQMRALAVNCSVLDPAVPTFAGAGVRGFETYLWFGFIAPPNLSHSLMEKLSSGIRHQGAEVWHKDPAGIRAAVEADMAKRGPVVRAVGLTPE
jgi:tripartite-type tricarboxylate transporter receptor subunit TctC